MKVKPAARVIFTLLSDTNVHDSLILGAILLDHTAFYALENRDGAK